MIRRKPGLLCVLLDFVLPVLVTPVLVAQSLLVPDAFRAAVRLEIRGHPGVAEVTLKPSAPVNGTHVVFNVTTLNSSMSLQLGEALGTVLSRGPKAPLILYRVNGGGSILPLATPKTRVELARTLRSLRKTSSVKNAEEESPLIPVGFESVIEQLEGLPDGWCSVVYVGPLPAVRAEASDYAVGRLLRVMALKKQRFWIWDPGGEGESPFRQASHFTAGGQLPAELDQLCAPWPGFEIQIPEAGLIAGFHLSRLTVIGGLEMPPRAFPWLFASEHTRFPTLEQYAQFRDRQARIQLLLGDEDPERLSSERLATVRELVFEQLLENPGDETALKVSLRLYEMENRPLPAARAGQRLLVLRPSDPDFLLRVGRLEWQAGLADAASQHALETRKLKPGRPEVAALLGQVAAAKGEYRAALDFLGESLGVDQNHADLWFLKADSHAALGQTEATLTALEQGVTLGGATLDRRTQLVKLYLAAGKKEQAYEQIRRVLPELPSRLDVLVQYAGFLEELGQAEEAAGVWRRVLEVDADHEAGHFALTQLLLKLNRLPEALQAAREGLTHVPGSPRLQLSEADCLIRLGEMNNARHVLLHDAQSSSDPALLARAAELEDRYGRGAAALYRRLVEVQLKSTERVHVLPTLRRSLLVAIRDGDFETAAWAQARLSGSGGFDEDLLPTGSERPVQRTLLPGGAKAVIHFIGGSFEPRREAVLADLCDYLIRKSDSLNEPTKDLRERLDTYFVVLNRLARFAEKSGDQITLRLSVRDRPSLERTDQILGLLGWKIRRKDDRLLVEPAEGGDRARRQEVASALGLDQVGMQETLETGTDFSFSVSSQHVNVFLGEESWMAQFQDPELVGGLVQGFARHADYAALYAALAHMEEKSARRLVKLFGLRPLTDYLRVLFDYSSCLLMDDRQVLVPGGPLAEPAWEALADASPKDSARFLEKLFKKDEGKLIRLYYTIANLDLPRQRFFTSSRGRLQRLYRIVRDLKAFDTKTSEFAHRNSVRDLLREVPLDSAGRLEFPGSPEVWLVAKGVSSSAGRTERLLKKLNRTTAPEKEDEILFHVTGTEYEADDLKRSQAENFLAVVRLDALRDDPLDPESALLLAQNFADCEGFFPYFADLVCLGNEEFKAFFGLAAQIRGKDRVFLNQLLGDVHSSTKLLCLSFQNHVLDAEKTRALFLDLCLRVGAAERRSTLARAILDWTRGFLAACDPAWVVADADDVLLRSLIPPSGPVSAQIGETRVEVSPYQQRADRFARVLDLQAVTPISVLLGVQEALDGVSQGKDPQGELLTRIERLSAGLRHVGLRKESQVKGRREDNLRSFDPQDILTLARRIRQEATKPRKKPDLRPLKELTDDYFEELCSQTVIALSGLIYAYYLSPDDLLVAEDPLLLRKHEFVSLQSSLWSGDLFPRTDLVLSQEGEGSFVLGGFGDFGPVAGKIATRGMVDLDPTIFEMVAAQIAALRGVDWSQVGNEELATAGGRIKAAREWIVRASVDRAVANRVADATLGLLSVPRRIYLTEAIQRRDWPAVWDALSLSDLYFLAGRLHRLETDKFWTSPVIEAWLKPEAHTPGIRWLGPTLGELRRYPSPRLVELPPYEDCAASTLLASVSQRCAELGLYLADFASGAGLDAGLLPVLAEPLALRLLRRARLTGANDWKDVLRAYTEMTERDVQEALRTR